MRLSIFGPDNAALDEAAYIGMIASQAGDTVRTHEVDARVANVRKAEFTIDDRQGSTSGSHAMKLGVIVSVALDVLVRRTEGMEQGSLRAAIEAAVIEVADGFDGKAAGFLSAFVSAHAIGDDGEASLDAEIVVVLGLPIEIGIFVIGALAANVGQAGHFHSWFCGAAVYRHEGILPLRFIKMCVKPRSLYGNDHRLVANQALARAFEICVAYHLSVPRSRRSRFCSEKRKSRSFLRLSSTAEIGRPLMPTSWNA